MTPETLQTIRKTASAVYRKTPNAARGTLGKDDFASIGTLAVLEAGETSVPVHTIAYRAMISAIRKCAGRDAIRRTALPFDESLEREGVPSRNHRLVDCELALEKLPESVSQALVRHYLDGEPWESDGQRKAVQRCLTTRLP